MPEAEKKESEKSPEVTEKATRRRFTLAYKERILAEADQCDGAGELGKLLRREGLYSSSLSRWRERPGWRQSDIKETVPLGIAG